MLRPAFVVGAERSGSTLLRLMLDQHPQLSFPHQLEFVVDFVGDDGSFPDLDTYLGHLWGEEIFKRSNFKVAGTGYEDYRQVVDDFLLQRRGEATVVGGTIHRNFHRLPFIWPDARYIHLLRDPRAVARSAVQMGWYGNVYAAADGWLQALDLVARLAQQLGDDSRLLTVTYEDLVRQPEATLTRICAFLGVDYDPRMLSFHQHTTYEAVDPKLADGWRRMSPQDIARVEAKVGARLEQLGYQRSSQRDRAIGAGERILLGVDDRIRKMRARQSRYGVWLWAQSVVARRLRPWVDGVRERIAKVDARYIK